MQSGGDAYKLLGRFYWSCLRLKDTEAAKDVAQLEVVKQVFRTEKGHIMNGYMQILYNNGHYEDLCKVCEEEYGNVRAQLPHFLIAALYRIGTPEAYAKAKSYDSESQHYRLKLITALFAYHQKDFDFIEETVKDFSNRLLPGMVPKLPSANLHILTMLEKGQLKELLTELNQWMGQVDEAGSFRLNIMKEVHEKLETAIENSKEDGEIQQLWDAFQHFNHLRYRVDSMTLEEYIFKPMSLAPNPRKSKYKDQLESRNLSRGARIVGSQPDLPPE